MKTLGGDKHIVVLGEATLGEKDVAVEQPTPPLYGLFGHKVGGLKIADHTRGKAKLLVTHGDLIIQ